MKTLREAGKTVVFTNGCFDILHPGHIHTLTQAKALGDVLIVGINSDASVKRLKGERRPILNQNERTVMLAALEAIDYVTDPTAPAADTGQRWGLGIANRRRARYCRSERWKGRADSVSGRAINHWDH
jgi:cytidyltransferase-like protein